MARRKKGGQRLMEMAGITPASRKRAFQKRKKARAAKEDRPGGRFYKTLLKAKPKAKAKTKPKAKAKTAVIKRGGTTITYKPKPSPQLKPKAKAKRKIHTVRMYTAEDERKYKERYKKTARKPDPAFARAKPKPTKKPVVAPPKGVKATRPGAGLTKRLTTIRKKAASRKATGAMRFRTPTKADLTKQQKTLVAEGKKIAKKFGLKIPAPSVRTAEKIGVPVEWAGWVLLALTGKGKARQMAGKKWSKLKELFGKKSSVMGGVGDTLSAGAAARGSGLGAARTAEQIAKAKRAKERADKLRKAKKAATSGGGYGKPG